MDKNRYKQQFYDDHYERIHLAVPKGMKDIIKTLASEKGMSINAYLQDLVRKDQEALVEQLHPECKDKPFHHCS